MKAMAKTAKTLMNESKSLVETVEALTRFKLSDFQRRAIEKIESSNRNLIIVAPTGAGKSIIGYAALLKQRGFYLAPLIAIMNEKYRDLSTLMKKLNKTVVVTNRDYRIPYFVVNNADVRIMSPYKFLTYAPSLEIRNDVVVVDEFHKLSGDSLFEAAITYAKSRNCRIVALSATVDQEDLDKLAKWLDAEVIIEKTRPVKLVHEKVKLTVAINGDVYSTSKITYRDRVVIDAGERFKTRYDLAAKLAAGLYSASGKPVIVWAPTRRLVENIAYKIASMLPEYQQFRAISTKIAGSSSSENLLKFTVRHGVWIHHGGLGYGTRSLVEEKYREMGGVIVTAYTLSHGVNLPGTFLVLSTIFDYASKPIDPTIFHQISGRAGRPGYDNVGIVLSVLVGKSEEKYYEWLLTQTASRITPTLLDDELAVVKLSLPVYAETRDMRMVERILSDSYSAFTGRAVGSLLGLVRREIEYYKSIDPEFAHQAMVMGLHHLEFEAIQEAIRSSDYREAVTEVTEKACILLNVNPSQVEDIVEDLMQYGFLATWFGKIYSREVADMVQTILESGVFWASRVYGWKSREREKMSELAKKFAYAGNPLVEPLAKSVRIDVLRRMIKAVPSIIEGATEDDAVVLTPVAIKEAYIGKKTVTRKKLNELMKLTYYAMTGKNPDPDKLALMDTECRRLLSEINVKVR